MCANIFFFSGTLVDLGSSTYLSVLLIVIIFSTTFGFGVNILGVTLFYNLYKEVVHRGELIYIPGGNF